MSRRVPITAYLEPKQLEALQKLSELTHVPMAEYVRQALDLLLGTLQRKLTR